MREDEGLKVDENRGSRSLHSNAGCFGLIMGVFIGMPLAYLCLVVASVDNDDPRFDHWSTAIVILALFSVVASAIGYAAALSVLVFSRLTSEDRRWWLLPAALGIAGMLGWLPLKSLPVKPLRTLAGHRDAVCAVAFSPDGRMLARS